MSSDLAILSQDAADRTERCVIAFEQQSAHQPSGRKASRQQPVMQPIRAILLEDLVTDGQADCSVSIYQPDQFIQKLAFLGDVQNTSKFALSFAPLNGTAAKTDFLPYNITAAALQTALENLSTIGKGNVLVSLGQDPDDSAKFPGVWLVTFQGKFAKQTGPNPPTAPPLMTVDTSRLSILGLMRVDATVWGDTGTTETMIDAIPVGTPTPMRAGAVAWGQWLSGVGYCCTACEGREFSVI